MKFKNLKVGDAIVLVAQRRNVSKSISLLPTVVKKVGKKYGYVMFHARLHPFCLLTGRSHHPDGNERANFLGFDMYWSQADYDDTVKAEEEKARLHDRILQKTAWPRLIDMTPATVQSLHKVLDQAGVPAQGVTQ